MRDATPSLDLNYRPRSYFWAQELGLALTPAIQGAERRRLYEQAIAAGASIPTELMKPRLSRAERSAWGSIHPSLMGGEYLPPLKRNEVEVARIVIASTMSDVVCVYARPYRRKILLRVVDEHEGMMLDEPTTLISPEPLSLGEFLDFFLTGWNLLEVLTANAEEHGYAADRVHGFITSATSSFYPGFEAALRQRVYDWLEEVSPEGEAEDEDGGADEEQDDMGA